MLGGHRAVVKVGGGGGVERAARSDPACRNILSGPKLLTAREAREPPAVSPVNY